MKIKWSQLGGQLGIGVCVLGLFFVFLGWNGAASYDRETAQIPYVISGGLMGLGIIIIGAALIVVQNQRADRAALQSTLDDIRRALDMVAATGVPTNGQTATATVAAGAAVAACVTG